MGAWSSVRTLRLLNDGLVQDDHNDPNDLRLSSRTGGFNFVSELHVDFGFSGPQLAALLGGLPPLAAFKCQIGILGTFADVCAALAKGADRQRHLRAVALPGIDSATSMAAEAKAMRSLGKLKNLETLVTAPGRLPLPTTLSSLRRLHLTESLESEHSTVSDAYLAAVLATYPLQTLALSDVGPPNWAFTGSSLRSASLTELSLHACVSLTTAGLSAMVGALPALKRFVCRRAANSGHMLVASL